MKTDTFVIRVLDCHFHVSSNCRCMFTFHLNHKVLNVYLFKHELPKIFHLNCPKLSLTEAVYFVHIVGRE